MCPIVAVVVIDHHQGWCHWVQNAQAMAFALWHLPISPCLCDTISAAEVGLDFSLISAYPYGTISAVRTSLDIQSFDGFAILVLKVD